MFTERLTTDQIEQMLANTVRTNRQYYNAVDVASIWKQEFSSHILGVVVQTDAAKAGARRHSQNNVFAPDLS
jgi:hypothetical protein